MDPDGKLHMAHDPYDPKYPEGSTPGLGIVHAKLGHYANDTSGYTFTVSDFCPAWKSLENSLEWANPAVAVLEGGSALLAKSEEELAPMLHEGLSVKRPSILLVGEDRDIAPEVAVVMNPGMREVVLTGPTEDVSAYLVDKYDVSMPDGEGNPLPAIVEALKERYSFSFKLIEADDMVFTADLEMDTPEM
jgi:hypothetical protein